MDSDPKILTKILVFDDDSLIAKYEPFCYLNHQSNQLTAIEKSKDYMTKIFPTENPSKQKLTFQLNQRKRRLKEPNNKYLCLKLNSIEPILVRDPQTQEYAAIFNEKIELPPQCSKTVCCCFQRVPSDNNNPNTNKKSSKSIKIMRKAHNRKLRLIKTPQNFLNFLYQQLAIKYDDTSPITLNAVFIENHLKTFVPYYINDKTDIINFTEILQHYHSDIGDKYELIRQEIIRKSLHAANIRALLIVHAKKVSFLFQVNKKLMRVLKRKKVLHKLVEIENKLFISGNNLGLRLKNLKLVSHFSDLSEMYTDAINYTGNNTNVLALRQKASKQETSLAQPSGSVENLLGKFEKNIKTFCRGNCKLKTPLDQTINNIYKHLLHLQLTSIDEGNKLYSYYELLRKCESDHVDYPTLVGLEKHAFNSAIQINNELKSMNNVLKSIVSNSSDYCKSIEQELGAIAYTKTETPNDIQYVIDFDQNDKIERSTSVVKVYYKFEETQTSTASSRAILQNCKSTLVEMQNKIVATQTDQSVRRLMLADLNAMKSLPTMSMQNFSQESSQVVSRSTIGNSSSRNLVLWKKSGPFYENSRISIATSPLASVTKNVGVKKPVVNVIKSKPRVIDRAVSTMSNPRAIQPTNKDVMIMGFQKERVLSQIQNTLQLVSEKFAKNKSIIKKATAMNSGRRVKKITPKLITPAAIWDNMKKKSAEPFKHVAFSTVTTVNKPRAIVLDDTRNDIRKNLNKSLDLLKQLSAATGRIKAKKAIQPAPKIPTHSNNKPPTPHPKYSKDSLLPAKDYIAINKLGVTSNASRITSQSKPSLKKLTPIIESKYFMASQKKRQATSSLSKIAQKLSRNLRQLTPMIRTSLEMPKPAYRIMRPVIKILPTQSNLVNLTMQDLVPFQSEYPRRDHLQKITNETLYKLMNSSKSESLKSQWALLHAKASKLSIKSSGEASCIEILDTSSSIADKVASSEDFMLQPFVLSSNKSTNQAVLAGRERSLVSLLEAKTSSKTILTIKEASDTNLTKILSSLTFPNNRVPSLDKINNKSGKRRSKSRERSSSPKDRKNYSSREHSVSPSSVKVRSNSVSERLIRSKERSRERSYSPNERLYSPRERSYTPKERSNSPRERSYSPKERPYSPRERSYSPKERSNCPRERSYSPKERSNSLNERSYSPNERSNSPRERPYSAKERSYSATERPYSPKERSYSATDRSYSPKARCHSPKERSNNPKDRSYIPNERLYTPRERSNSPRERSNSPRERPYSPKERPYSPRERPYSPRERPYSPRERPNSPRERPYSPKESLTSRKEYSNSSKTISTRSKERPITPKERPITPKERTITPKERPITPKGRLLSARDGSANLRERVISPKEKHIHRRQQSKVQPSISKTRSKCIKSCSTSTKCLKSSSATSKDRPKVHAERSRNLREYPRIQKERTYAQRERPQTEERSRTTKERNNLPRERSNTTKERSHSTKELSITPKKSATSKRRPVTPVLPKAKSSIVVERPISATGRRPITPKSRSKSRPTSPNERSTNWMDPEINAKKVKAIKSMFNTKKSLETYLMHTQTLMSEKNNAPTYLVSRPTTPNPVEENKMQNRLLLNSIKPPIDQTVLNSQPAHDYLLEPKKPLMKLSENDTLHGDRNKFKNNGFPCLNNATEQLMKSIKNTENVLQKILQTTEGLEPSIKCSNTTCKACSNKKLNTENDWSKKTGDKPIKTNKMDAKKRKGVNFDFKQYIQDPTAGRTTSFTICPMTVVTNEMKSEYLKPSTSPRTALEKSVTFLNNNMKVNQQVLKSLTKEPFNAPIPPNLPKFESVLKSMMKEPLPKTKKPSVVTQYPVHKEGRSSNAPKSVEFADQSNRIQRIIQKSFSKTEVKCARKSQSIKNTQAVPKQATIIQNTSKTRVPRKPLPKPPKASTTQKPTLQNTKSTTLNTKRITSARNVESIPSPNDSIFNVTYQDRISMSSIDSDRIDKTSTHMKKYILLIEQRFLKIFSMPEREKQIAYAELEKEIKTMLSILDNEDDKNELRQLKIIESVERMSNSSTSIDDKKEVPVQKLKKEKIPTSIERPETAIVPKKKVSRLSQPTAPSSFLNEIKEILAYRSKSSKTPDSHLKPSVKLSSGQKTSPKRVRFATDLEQIKSTVVATNSNEDRSPSFSGNEDSYTDISYDDDFMTADIDFSYSIHIKYELNYAPVQHLRIVHFQIVIFKRIVIRNANTDIIEIMPEKINLISENLKCKSDYSFHSLMRKSDLKIFDSNQQFDSFLTKTNYPFTHLLKSFEKGDSSINDFNNMESCKDSPEILEFLEVLTSLSVEMLPMQKLHYFSVQEHVPFVTQQRQTYFLINQFERAANKPLKDIHSTLSRQSLALKRMVNRNYHHFPKLVSVTDEPRKYNFKQEFFQNYHAATLEDCYIRVQPSIENIPMHLLPNKASGSLPNSFDCLSLNYDERGSHIVDSTIIGNRIAELSQRLDNQTNIRRKHQQNSLSEYDFQKYMLIILYITVFTLTFLCNTLNFRCE